MDPSDPTYVSQTSLAAKYPWFTKMHEMMGSRYVAELSLLLTMPSLDSASDVDPMDEDADSMAKSIVQPTHGHNLPALFDLVDQGTIAGPSSGTDMQSTPRMPMPSGAAFSTLSTPSTSSSTGKHKRGAVDQKKDAIADAFYCSQANNMQLQLEQERTKHEEMRVQAMEKLTAAMMCSNTNTGNQ
ncbi:hypothetical protein [Sporisorium scitamineum]|uniref:Uncharacterized protein n=1 Tax=Sporisorium scitamineum TaxID=49012 RepID=A0A0F7RVE6_9BASI|nr:hypothetical protein [Sporisorium scitamineum]